MLEDAKLSGLFDADESREPLGRWFRLLSVWLCCIAVVTTAWLGLAFYRSMDFMSSKGGCTQLTRYGKPYLNSVLRYETRCGSPQVTGWWPLSVVIPNVGLSAHDEFGKPVYDLAAREAAIDLGTPSFFGKFEIKSIDLAEAKISVYQSLINLTSPKAITFDFETMRFDTEDFISVKASGKHYDRAVNLVARLVNEPVQVAAPEDESTDQNDSQETHNQRISFELDTEYRQLTSNWKYWGRFEGGEVSNKGAFHLRSLGTDTAFLGLVLNRKLSQFHSYGLFVDFAQSRSKTTLKDLKLTLDGGRSIGGNIDIEGAPHSAQIHKSLTANNLAMAELLSVLLPDGADIPRIRKRDDPIDSITVTGGGEISNEADTIQQTYIMVIPGSGRYGLNVTGFLSAPTVELIVRSPPPGEWPDNNGAERVSPISPEQFWSDLDKFLMLFTFASIILGFFGINLRARS